MTDKCKKCSAVLPDNEKICTACGSTVAFDVSETQPEPDLPPDIAPTIIKETSTIATGDSGSEKVERFIAGTILDKRYRIIGLIGSGGMGEVYKAEDIKLKQTVALKFLALDFAENEEMLERFYGEVRHARQVSHQNVCRVFDIGELEGSHFISMEYIDGDDLSSLLRRIGRLPDDKAIEVSRQICLGLNAIHRAGILHRDLKPANVIVDSKGKAQITDFGIAGTERELRGDNAKVGTPAYMSPEQNSGVSVTTKSDIYSLGLLIYEIFTGKQVFQTNTADELIRKHRTETPVNPSDIIGNIDPVVEKTIGWCLAKKPEERPDSALQVAASLSGENPLHLALEAGETPSPEMVAAAPKKGVLNPLIAMACLGATLFGITLLFFFHSNIKLYNYLPLNKSPEALAERAKLVIEKVGYRDTPVDTDYDFAEDLSYFQYAAREETLEKSTERFRAGQPFELYFWYRQSPRYMQPTKRIRVAKNDPPNDVSGMATVMLDLRGRLIEMVVVPPQVVRDSEPLETDWRVLFDEAGLDISKFKETDSIWTPPTHSDKRIAWEGTYPDFPDIGIRIEAAAFQGIPVYFRIVAPWDKPLRDVETSTQTTASITGSTILIFILFWLALIGAGLVARYNIKMGNGDRKGAFRFSAFVFIISLCSLIYADHLPTLVGENFIVLTTLSNALINMAFIWLLYIALEPFVRRYCPNLLISWSRLLNGDFRDPIIGRDILVGGLIGIVGALAILGGVFLLLTFEDASVVDRGFFRNNLMGIPGMILTLSEHILTAVQASSITLFFLMLFYVLFRKMWLSAVISGIVLFVIAILGVSNFGAQWAMVPSSAIFSGLAIFAAVRFGFLALICMHLFFNLAWLSLFSFDISKFYFGSTVFVVVVMLGLATYGFYISIAGQPIIGGKILEDI